MRTIPVEPWEAENAERERQEMELIIREWPPAAKRLIEAGKTATESLQRLSEAVNQLCRCLKDTAESE